MLFNILRTMAWKFMYCKSNWQIRRIYFSEIVSFPCLPIDLPPPPQLTWALRWPTNWGSTRSTLSGSTSTQLESSTNYTDLITWLRTECRTTWDMWVTFLYNYQALKERFEELLNVRVPACSYRLPCCSTIGKEGWPKMNTVYSCTPVYI